jgi:hypothetical protein
MNGNLTLVALLAIAMFSMGQTCSPDIDGDGISDLIDGCPDTPICATVDADGCPSDDDEDGVANGCDECEDTPTDTIVFANGCEAVIDDGVPSACQGPDPRAKEIEYSLVNLIDSNTADIRIKGTVDNIGLSDYTSSAGQQSIELWEDNTMVASEAFINLAVGEEITVEYERTWMLTGAEFPPEHYKLIISYDPDITDDGNPENDDCRQSNNIIIRSVAGIDTLFD